MATRNITERSLSGRHGRPARRCYTAPAVSLPRNLATEIFTKAHNGRELKAALQLKDPAERFKRVNELTLTGRRKVVDPLAGASSPESGALIGKPYDVSSKEWAEQLIEVAGFVLLADTDLDAITSSDIGKELFTVLMNMGGNTIVADKDGVKRPGGMFRLNSARLGRRISPLLMNGYPYGYKQERGSFYPDERLGFYNGTEESFKITQAGNIAEPQKYGPPVPLLTPRALGSLFHTDPPTTIPELIGRELLAAKASPSSRFTPLRTIGGFIDYLGEEWIQTSINIACHNAMRECWKLKGYYSSPRPEESWPDGIKGELHPNFLQYGGPIIARMGPFLKTLITEGSPIHSDWPSGHAVIAGAGFTLLKAAFADQPFMSGGKEISSLHLHLDLVGWYGGLSRTALGIHTRSSLLAGMMLGQHHAIRLLNEQSANATMPLGRTVFMGFDGQMISVAGTH